jgi:ABC-type nitrate/sulfonate/bicarbonate transport system substrate-binding protein
MKTLFTAATLLAVASGCTEHRTAALAEPLTIAAATLPNFSLVYVAQAKGYFASEGLNVTLKHHQYGKLALEALLAGQADLATSAETPVVFAELRGEQLSIMASIGRSAKNNAVVALKESGVTKPADLAGKRVGVTRGTTADFFLDTFLLRYGVDRQEVRFVDLKPEEMAGALGRGEVAAVATWLPTTIALQDRFGTKVVVFYVEDFHAENAVLVARRGFEKRRPEVTTRVLRALLKAEALFRDHPDEARRSAASASDHEPGVPDSSLGQFKLQVRLDQSLLVLMEEESRWAIRSALVPPQVPPNFLATIMAEPLLAVKPDAVGLIR